MCTRWANYFLLCDFCVMTLTLMMMMDGWMDFNVHIFFVLKKKTSVRSQIMLAFSTFCSYLNRHVCEEISSLIITSTCAAVGISGTKRTQLQLVHTVLHAARCYVDACNVRSK